MDNNKYRRRQARRFAQKELRAGITNDDVMNTKHRKGVSATLIGHAHSVGAAEIDPAIMVANRMRDALDPAKQSSVGKQLSPEEIAKIASSLTPPNKIKRIGKLAWRSK